MSAHDAGTALVTGASSGLGAAFSRALASQGYGLILVARREERLTALAAELRDHHHVSAEPLVADLASPSGVELVEARIAELPTLDLLVNNAGFGTTGTFADVRLGKHLDMIHVHVVASVRLCHAALPGMIARGSGGIINVSSVAAVMPQGGHVTYCATKAYLRVFSETLRTELKGTGVQVQALVPGFTYTEFHDQPELEGFDRSQVPEALWMSAERVVEASLKALGRDRGVCIPGFRNRVLVALAWTGLPSLIWRVLGALRRR